MSGPGNARKSRQRPRGTVVGAQRRRTVTRVTRPTTPTEPLSLAHRLFHDSVCQPCTGDTGDTDTAGGGEIYRPVNATDDSSTATAANTPGP